MGGIAHVSSTATAIPINPPAKVKTSASNRNCTRMCRGRAPRALRRPISRVRSVTETSMIFITPTPPTAKVTAPINPSTACRPNEKPLIMALSSIVSHSGVALSSLGSKWWRLAITSRTAAKDFLFNSAAVGWKMISSGSRRFFRSRMSPKGMKPLSLSGPLYIESWILLRMVPMTSKSSPPMLTC